MATQKDELRKLIHEVEEMTWLLSASTNVSNEIKDSLQGLVDKVDSFEDLSFEQHQELLGNLTRLRDAIISAIRDGADTVGGLAFLGSIFAALINQPEYAWQRRMEFGLKVLFAALKPDTTASRAQLIGRLTLCADFRPEQADSLIELLLERGALEAHDDEGNLCLNQGFVELLRKQVGKSGLRELGW